MYDFTNPEDKKKSGEPQFVDGEWVKFPEALKAIRKEVNDSSCEHEFITIYPPYPPDESPEPRCICTKCNSEFEMFDRKQRYFVADTFKKLDKIKEVVKDYEDFILSLEGKRGIDLWDEDLGYVTHFEKAVEGIVKIQDILEDKG